MSSETSRQCATCGGTLLAGPLGWQCPACSLDLIHDLDHDDDAQAEELFPELTLEGKIGHGGFGTVFRAEQRGLKRTVALKFLDSILSRSPGAVSLFEQEMITVGGLDHPGIVRAYDAGERDGRWYILMEFVDGLDGGALARKHGRLPVAEACEIIRQAALALHHAHGKGLVHRDVKPGNLMVARCGEGKLAEGTKRTQRTEGTSANAPEDSPLPYAASPNTVKVLDFGLAGLALAPLFGGAPAPSKKGSPSASDTFFGTLEYTAPEQIEAPGSVDARADVYGLGATLWRFLAGRTPRSGAGEKSVSLFLHMKRITTEPVPPLATVRGDLPKELTRLCDSFMVLDRGQRPASAAEVAKLLEPWCAGAELSRLFEEGPLAEKPFPRPRGRRRGPWLAAGAALVVLGGALWPLVRPDPPAPTPAEMAKPRAPGVFSEQMAKAKKWREEERPRLLSGEWEHAYEVPLSWAEYGARFASDGALVFLEKREDAKVARRLGPSGKLETLARLPAAAQRLLIHPDGHLLWNDPSQREGLQLGRNKADGTALPSLRYDFASDFPPLTYELGRALVLNNGGAAGTGFPCGMAVVAEGQIPENTGLRAGDVLVADEGHRKLLQGVYSVPGLWTFRPDEDKPARRLGALPAETHSPSDVAVSRHGVYVLNRNESLPPAPGKNGDNLTLRIMRWDRDGFHPVTLNQPIALALSLAADPLTGDLFAMDGGFRGSASERRLLRLRRLEADRFDVEICADRLGKPAASGVTLSADGKLLCLTDEAHGAAAVLRRKEPTAAAERLVLSPALSQALGQAPRFLTDQWETESEHRVPHHLGAASLTPEGAALYLMTEPSGRTTVNSTAAAPPFPLGTGHSSRHLGVDPATGFLLWDQRTDRAYRHIGRARADGSPLEGLTFDPSGDFEPARRMEMRAHRERVGEEDEERRVGGFGFARIGNVPENTGLREGDVLVADEGHRWLAPRLFGLDVHGVPSLWKCRLDNNEPAVRLAKLPKFNTPTGGAASRWGVFLLNRPCIEPEKRLPGSDLNDRLYRWDLDGIHACQLDQPVADPSGIAADPNGPDLYLIEGATGFLKDPANQRLIRLRRAGPDRYEVETVADRFGKFAVCGLGISNDGKQLVLADAGLKVVVVLRKRR